MRQLALLLVLLLATALRAADETVAPPPGGFEKEIQALEAKLKAANPAQGIIAIGSSSFRRWSTMQADLAPLPVFNCAFGGSRTKDVTAAVPRLVLPAKPRVVLYYCGDNDMGGTASDWQVPVQGFKDFLAAVRAELPAIKVVYVSIKPSVKRWAVWPQVQQTNAAIKALCAADPALTYVDVSPPLLGADGQPKAELYAPDKLHLTAQGYALITPIIKPALEKAWVAAGGAPSPK